MNNYDELGSIEQYMRQVKQTPAPDAERDAVLLECVKMGMVEREKAAPDSHILHQAVEARNELVERLQPLVVSVARSLHPLFRSMDLLDVIQECNVVLLADLEMYVTCPFDGPLVAFFSSHLRFALLDVLRTRDGLVRIPERVLDLLGRRRRVERELRSRVGGQPSLAEVAAEMGMSSEALALEVAQVEALQGVQSLEGMLFEDEQQDKRNWVSLFAEGAAASAVFSHPELHTAMQQVLTPHEQRVVSLLYGIGEGGGTVRTHQMVGDVLGRTHAAVGEADKRARVRLREALVPVGAARVTHYQLREEYQDYYTTKQACQVLGIRSRVLYDCISANLVAYEEQSLREAVGGSNVRYRFPKREIDALAAVGGLTHEQRSFARRIHDRARGYHRSGRNWETTAARARRIQRDAVTLPSIVA